jgi:hypothetical protein
MIPNAPRYVSPKEVAENRARLRRFLCGTLVAIFVIIGLMAIGYSDQAPAWLRAATEALDAEFGYPVLRVIALLAS